ncbi:hypothetical protein BV898_10926 [Hypsibius exemplaris]|uniref:Uncharacterized protein n=1 Tax=Hypsibius exemplaris TaxID=2072580 RepID=A0A1W0WI58_HYPEX|nr:hypothetical protein BV898_10926 [Hypsibius exemplaris]
MNRFLLLTLVLVGVAATFVSTDQDQIRKMDNTRQVVPVHNEEDHSKKATDGCGKKEICLCGQRRSKIPRQKGGPRRPQSTCPQKEA